MKLSIRVSIGSTATIATLFQSLGITENVLERVGARQSTIGDRWQWLTVDGAKYAVYRRAGSTAEMLVVAMNRSLGVIQAGADRNYSAVPWDFVSDFVGQALTDLPSEEAAIEALEEFWANRAAIT
jgi:hypothetical protein